MTYADNILSVFKRATHDDILAGLSWYGNAHMVAREAGDVRKGAGVISALSPRMPWQRNLTLARDAFVAPLTGGALKRSIGAANAIMHEGADPLDILGGLKTRAFFDNILNPLTSAEVTVDTHAIKIAGIDRDSVGVGLYREISDAYRHAAAIAGIAPLDMQAVTWTTYRRESNMWTHRKEMANPA